MSDRFYSLRPGWSRQYIVADLDMPGEEQAGLSYNMREFDGSLRAVVEEGSKPGDLMRTFSLVFFVSSKVIEVLESQGLASYRAGRVELVGGRSELPDYHWLAFHGKGGPILPEQSGIVWGRVGPDGKPSIRHIERLVFDVDQWDGSDLLYLEELPGLYVVSERAKEALEKAKLTNCELKSLLDIHF